MFVIIVRCWVKSLCIKNDGEDASEYKGNEGKADDANGDGKDGGDEDDDGDDDGNAAADDDGGTIARSFLLLIAERVWRAVCLLRLSCTCACMPLRRSSGC